MVKNLKKILSILCVLVMTATVFSAVITNVLADENGEEKDTWSLNPDVATNEYIHMVWQENLTGNYEIYYANNLTGAYKTELSATVQKVQGLIENTTDKKLKSEFEKVLKELNKTLANATANDYHHSFKHLQHAVERLDKKDLNCGEIITALVNSARDITKVNILYREFLNISQDHTTKAWEKFYKGLEKVNEEKYDKAVNEFRKAFKEAYKIDDDCEDEECSEKTNAGIDFGKIVKISYTEFDSVEPQIFLNGTISVGWKEIMDSESHVYYARSSNNGKTWWYFDAAEYGYNYLSAIGLNPYSVSIETTLRVTRALEDIRAVHGCHYIYTPIVIKETGIIDRHYYSPINDPYLELYKDRYEIVPIDGREFYIICGGPMPSPPPKMPDLTFRYAYPSKPLPVEGEKITVYANITNQGDATVSGEVSSTFLQKDILVGNVSVSPPLNPGEGKLIEKEYTVTAGRHVMIQSIADPNNDLLDEGNKDNNIISFPMNIVKEVKNDWSITDAKRLDDMDIHLAGNMAVQAGGKLELNDTFLLVNSTTSGKYIVNITNGGKVDINNTIIQSKNSSIGYKFIVNGEMNLTRSAVGDMWGNETGIGGVEIYSNASITDSAIHDGNGSGLYVKDSSPMIANTTILYNNVYDIYLDTNAAPTFLNCIFNESKVYFKDTTSKLNIERYMHAMVVDSNDEPVMNATATVKDNNGVTVYTGLTNYYGYARWIPVPYRVVTKTSDGYLSHTVTVTKDGVSGLKVLEGWEDDLNLSVSGSSASSDKQSVLTVDRNKNTYWEGLAGQSSYSLTLDTGHSIAQGNMSIYYPKGCTDKYNMTVKVHSHSGIGTTGHGLLFDGVNDYVAATCTLPSTSLTIEFWMKPTAVTGFDHPIGLGGDHMGTVYLYDGNGRMSYKFYNLGGTKIEGSFGSYTLNQWQHIVVTYDGLEVRGYLNGGLGGSTPASGSINYQNSDVIIGADVGGFKSFNGIVDEVRILNRAMSPDEIKQDYTNKIYNPADGVVGWWHFDENANNTVYDATSNYNNGTIYGATWTNGISNGGVREITVVKASTNTVTNVLLSPNPDIIDKVEIIFNTWNNTPKISEITGIGDTVSPELAKTIAKERIKLLAREDYPEWVNATVSEPVVYYSSLGDPVVYEMAILSQTGSVIGSMHTPVKKRGQSVSDYSTDEPWFTSSENRTLFGYEKPLSGIEVSNNTNLSGEEREKAVWGHFTHELLFEQKWGSKKYELKIQSLDKMPHRMGLCVAASGAMIMGYWAATNSKYKNLADVTVDELTTAMKYDVWGGKLSEQYVAPAMVSVSSDHKVGATADNKWGLVWGGADKYYDYCREINNNRPTIEIYRYWSLEASKLREGHAVVGVGYLYWTITYGWGWLSYTILDGRHAYINDPAKSTNYIYSNPWVSGRAIFLIYEVTYKPYSAW